MLALMSVVPSTVGDRPSLDDIGRRFETDKSSAGHDYLRTYEEHLGHLRDEPIVLAEIGVYQGASLRTWTEYFSRARIVGVDLHPISENLGDRVTVVRGDQADPGFLGRFGAEHRPDVIVDDGSHIWAHQLITFDHLFPFLAEGGLYICEDLHTSFGVYRADYSFGAATSPVEYFASLAGHVVAGQAEPVDSRVDPHLYYVKNRIRTMTFFNHALIIATRGQRPPRAA